MRSSRFRMTRRTGFTLIELLIVIAIILILIAIALPNFLESQMRAKVARVQAEQRSFSIAMESYYQDFRDYPPDFFDVVIVEECHRGSVPGSSWRAVLDRFTSAVHLGLTATPGGPAFLHPGRSATLQFGPKNIAGWFGEFHPSVLEGLDVDGPIVGFEITLDALPAPKQRPTKARPKLDLSDFMPLERDFAFLVDRAVRSADIIKAAQSAERALVTGASVFDVYEGQGVPEGKKSVAVSVTLQPRERTLTDAEIDAAAQKIVAEVA